MKKKEVDIFDTVDFENWKPIAQTQKKKETPKYFSAQAQKAWFITPKQKQTMKKKVKLPPICPKTLAKPKDFRDTALSTSKSTAASLSLLDASSYTRQQIKRNFSQSLNQAYTSQQRYQSRSCNFISSVCLRNSTAVNNILESQKLI
jgi:hypothetical protein